MAGVAITPAVVTRPANGIDSRRGYAVRVVGECRPLEYPEQRPNLPHARQHVHVDVDDYRVHDSDAVDGGRARLSRTWCTRFLARPTVAGAI